MKAPMKKYLLAFLPCLMLSLPGIDHQTVRAQGAPDDLQPTMSQLQVEKFVTQILTTYHYRKISLSDSLSSKVFDSYLKDMDNGHNYLIADDVVGFEKFRYNLDEDLKKGDLTAAYMMYNVLINRIKERLNFTFKVLEKPFDYSIDESFDTDREKAKWAKNTAELDEVWRKVLKNQALDLKLSGKADTAVASTLKSRYKLFEKRILKLKGDDVFQTFMNAFTNCIDPHTTYFIPKAASNFNMEMSQSLEGIGATLQQDNDYTKIVDLRPGGPAIKSAQVQINDRIVGVAQGENGPMVDVIGWLTDDVVQLVRGPKGTTVRLNLLPAEASAAAPMKEVRLVREKIKLEEQRAKAEVVPIKENGKDYQIGVISIPLFYRDFSGERRKEADFVSTTRDVQRLIGELNEKKVEGIVIDLRNNGGGSLVEAISLTGLFITKGPVVQVKDADGSVGIEDDQDPSQVYEGPLAVLVNRFSASASEIFAGAIQDYKRGLVVGEQTYGKGTVQSMIDLNNFLPKDVEKPGQLNLTRAKFYRITGSSTQHKGVTPDFELPSGFSASEFGESAEPSALPWDQIASTRYEIYHNVDDRILADIKATYEKRLKSDAELVKLAKDFEEFRKNREKTIVSLQETKRKIEREEQEKKRVALNKTASAAGAGDDGGDEANAAAVDNRTASANTAKSKLDKDVYLKECGRLLADLISFRK